MRSPLGVASLVLVFVATLSCGSKPSTSSPESPKPPEELLKSSTYQSGLEGPSLSNLERIRPAGRIRHEGIRLIRVFDELGVLTYREKVVTNGDGKFSVRPIEALSSVDPEWQFRQLNREGFIFRYRDFTIRDPDLFARNYTLTDLDAPRFVAGRLCADYQVTGRGPTPTVTYLSVDKTGLVMRYEEFDGKGQRVSSMIYETFEPRPNLADAIWFEGVHDEQRLDLSKDLGKQVGGNFPKPRLVPKGFELREAYSLVDGDHDWVKLVYTDGVKPLFYLFHEREEPRAGKLETVGSTARTGPVQAEAESIIVFNIGAARAAQAILFEGSYLVVGKVDEAQLVDMIESASD